MIAVEAAGAVAGSPSTRSRHGLRTRYEAWALFAVAHLLLSVLSPLASDVTVVYRPWFETWAQHGTLVGIDGPWVYPVLALVPILAAGAVPGAYLLGWVLLVTVLDAAAFAMLLRRSRRAAIWWMVLLIALGPVALTRLDSVTAPIAIAGLLLLAERPAVASTLLTVAAWIKVWPAAAVLAAWTATRSRRLVGLAAAATTAAVVALDAALGGLPHLLSFLPEQSTRGLQIEAPVSTVFLWLGAFGLGHVRTYFDRHLLDVQLVGDGSAAAGEIVTALTAALVVALAVVALRGSRRGSWAGTGRFAHLVLALLLVLITFNKVGSPQYVIWLAAPVVLGLVVDPATFRRTATTVVALALLTQLSSYAAALNLGALPLLGLTARNALYLVLLMGSCRRVLAGTRLGSIGSRPATGSAAVVRA
ncbi:hypothetical protein QDR37_10530 [Amnibacterium sp. CER49]|uniref:hypothetical protein n=1 Tax=Amnibacterium sp. CER49 TaxID=3039161 RepID=UPI0024474B4A|nr:hypothetical protein [Amnibacterium sp. CER49]MDH2444378.1 hypothetical protein [Amnibacterium sp. CER49]